jgi:hypothetical protein
MNKNKIKFDQEIAIAKTAEAGWAALEKLSKSIDGHILFTVMTVDMEAGLARRAYSSHPAQYPVTGTKPIHRDAWFDIVHGERRSFVANTIMDIAKVFSDFELIQSLGCGSVINLPVVLRNELVATVNLLHAEQHYSAQRVDEIEAELSVPAKLCVALAALTDAHSHG